MTKKRRSLFIVLGVVCVCVLSCAFVLTGCGNKHKYGDSWTYDETSHWHQCTKHDDDADDVEDKEKHTFVDVEDGVITEATCETAGEKKVVCSVCGYETTQTVAALEHTFTITDEEKDITWKWADDNKSATATAVCDLCKKDISLAVTMSSAVNGDGDTVYTATVTINGTAYTSTQTVTGSTQEPEGGEETKYSVTVTGDNLSTSTVSGYDYALSLDITDGQGKTDVVYGSATLTAALFADGTEVGDATATWSWDEGYTTYVSFASGTITAVAAGETKVTVIYYDTDDTTVLAQAVIGVAIVDSRYAGVTVPDDYAEKLIEDATVSVDFSDSSTYSWISGKGVTTENGKTTIAQQNSYSTGVLTLYTSTETSKTMTINDEAENALNTNGKTSKNNVGEQSDVYGIYFLVDLSGYVGDYVTIEIKMASNSDTASRSLFVSSKLEAPDLTSKPGLANATSTGKKNYQTLSYGAEITENSKILYITCDASVNIYTIDINIYGDNKPETGTSRVAVTFDEDIEYNGATFENTSSLTVTYTETTEDGVTTGKYVLSGYANVMTQAQVEAFGGDATVGTPYVVYGILLQPGDTISGIASNNGSWTYPAKDDNENDNVADYYVFIVSVSDVSVGGRQDKTYTVTTVGNETITITIDFTQVEDPEAATDGAVAVDGTFDMIVTNGENTYQALVENADGFKVVLNKEGEFVLTGIANKLTDEQAYVFYGGNTSKKGGENFIAYGIILEDGDTIINLNTGWTETYAENGGLYIMVSTVTGQTGYYTYAIISEDGKVTLVNVSFAGVVIAETAANNAVTVENVSASFDRAPDVTFTNRSGFTYTYKDGEFALSGKANVMSTEQATAFVGEDPNGVATAGDYYIVIGIALTEGQTIYNLQSGYSETYADNNSMYYMILRLTKTSGHRMFALVDTTTEDDGSATVTSVTLIKVTFAGVDITWATGITLTGGTVEGNNNQSVSFSNEGGLTVDTTVDEDGNVTITVTGTASTMDDDQANDFWAGHAANGDAYIVVTVTFRENETVSWVSSAGDTRTRTISDYPEGKFDMVIRISGSDLSDEIEAGTLTFTITDSHGKAVTYTVDFTALLADEGGSGEPGTTEPEPEETYTITITQGTDDDTGAIKLTAVVSDGNGEVSDATVTWSSQNPEYATIDATTGVITVVETGTATFVATYQYGENATDVVSQEYSVNVEYEFEELTINVSDGTFSGSVQAGTIGSTGDVTVSLTSSANVGSNTRTDGSGVFTSQFTTRFQLGGTATASANSVKFELNRPADVTVWVESSSTAYGRIVGFFTVEGETITTVYQEIAYTQNNTIYGWTVSLQAGTYYFGSVNSSLNVFAIVVSEYTGNYTSDAPAGTEVWALTESETTMTLYYLAGGDTVEINAEDLISEITVDGVAVENPLTLGGTTTANTVVSVKNNVFTVVGAGTTTLTVTLTYGFESDSKVSSSEITVTVIGYSVEISGEGITGTTVTEGDEFTLTLKNSDGTEITGGVTYTIDSDTDSVSENDGTFSAGVEGCATITVKVDDTEIGTITITVEAAESGGDSVD